MPYIDVTYKRNVSRRAVRDVVATLYTMACVKGLVESDGLDVYARRLGKLDRQRKLIMVRIHADPKDYIKTPSDADRIEQEIWSLLCDRVIPTQIGVEIIHTLADS